MTELKQGTMIKLTTGEQVKVQKELGRGGQGIVYLCEFNGQQYALKWYIQDYPDAFYNNLKTNIQNGSPNGSKAFLWPLMLTEKQHDSFGYVMGLLPSTYLEFGEFLLAKAAFISVDKMINAAINLTKGYQDLSISDYIYADLNDGCLNIHPETGDIIFTNTDIIHKNNINLGIMGTMRYMAPEIVLGSKPDRYSDYFSLSVVLFLIFFKNHPLEGQKVLGPLLSPAHEKKFYGSEAVFIYDKADNSNVPVKGIHNNVVKLWPLYPSLLRDAFTEAFSQEVIKNPDQRLQPEKWLQILTELRNRLVTDENGIERFLTDDEPLSNNGNLDDSINDDWV